MKGHRYILFYAEALAQCFGEVRHKAGISIRDDLSWQAKPSVYVFVIEDRYSFSGDGGFARQE